MNAIQKVREDKTQLAKIMPEKMELSRLQHHTDTVLLSGLNRMKEILDMPYEEKTIDMGEGPIIKVIEPKSKVAAFAQVIAMGRYIELRKTNIKEEAIEVDFSEGEDAES